MANLPISGLPELAAAPAVDDVLPIVDTSATTTKKITVANLAKIAAGTGTEIQYRNSGAFGAMSGTAWDDTNRSLIITGATVTTDNPILNLTQTWNAGGVTFTGLKINVTNTASAVASKLLDLQIGGTTKFKVSRDGVVTIGAGDVNTPSLVMGTAGNGWFDGGGVWDYAQAGALRFRLSSNLIISSVGGLNFSSTSSAGGTVDLGFWRNAAGVAEINNGTAGIFRDIKVRDIIIDSGTLAKSSTAFTNGAAAASGTLLNAPSAGNPTKWIPVNDNGTTRYIPAW